MTRDVGFDGEISWHFGIFSAKWRMMVLCARIPGFWILRGLQRLILLHQDTEKS